MTDTIPPPPATPSASPRSITWPMVAYQLVRELPNLCIIAAGIVVAGLLLARAPSATLEPLASVLGSALVAGLVRRGTLTE